MHCFKGVDAKATLMESFIWLGFIWGMGSDCKAALSFNCIIRINNGNAAANTVFSYNDFDIKNWDKKNW
jgi:hypothetical protein